MSVTVEGGGGSVESGETASSQAGIVAGIRAPDIDDIEGPGGSD